MMNEKSGLPDHVKAIDRDSQFRFSCHKGVKCFTECCRMLELSLTPYDVLRLRMGTGKTSSELLDEVIIIEQEPGEPFPRFYLTMVDDGRASCVYVSKNGCAIYRHRPGACRAYPLGRAVRRTAEQSCDESFVVIREPHCLGFKEDNSQSPVQYMTDQELTAFNRFNDIMATILQHESIQQGFVPSAGQVELFTLALYNIDSFREQLFSGESEFLPKLRESERTALADDEQLLLFGMTLVQRELFSIF